MTMMSGNTFIARSPDVAARTFGYELMIMSGRDSALFSLNETGSLPWPAADGCPPAPHSVKAPHDGHRATAPATAPAEGEHPTGALPQPCPPPLA